MNGLADAVLDALAGLDSVTVALLVTCFMAVETSLLIGLFVPGDSVVLLAGATVTSPAGFALVVGATTLGSLVGESLGWLLGHRYGDRVRRSRVGRRIGEQRWARAAVLLDRRSGAAIVGSRFLAVVHALVPVLAGSARMPYRRFIGWAVLGSFVWAVAFAGAGTLAGVSFRQAGEGLGLVGYAGLVIVVVAGVGARLMHRRARPSRPSPAGTPLDVRDQTSRPGAGLRVLVVTESFLPRVNGVTGSVCRVLEHLAVHGHEVLVLAPRPAPPSYAGYPVRDVPSLPLPGYRRFRVGWPVRRQVRAALRDFRPDVVHVASPALLGAVALREANAYGVPSVAVFQTDLAGFARRYGARGTDRLIWAWLRRAHERADVTLAASTATMSQLLAHDVPRLAPWPRGVDTDLFRPDRRREALRRLLADDGEVLVGYVGRLAAEKRVHQLAVLDDLPGVRLVIVGAGPAERRLRRALPGAQFLGELHGVELATAVASLDVVVHTGADETFCQAAQEALASGVPVVVPATGGPLDYVCNGHNGLLYGPDHVGELRAAVRLLAVDPKVRSRLAANARPSVQARTWDTVGDALLAHYRRLTTSPPPRNDHARAVATRSA